MNKPKLQLPISKGAKYMFFDYTTYSRLKIRNEVPELNES